VHGLGHEAGPCCVVAIMVITLSAASLAAPSPSPQHLPIDHRRQVVCSVTPRTTRAASMGHASE
jgi:hypothetical protein